MAPYPCLLQIPFGTRTAYPPPVAASENPINDFGLLIAYILPGFTALWGASYLWEPLGSWFGTTPLDAPTVGGFLFLTLASITAGLTVSTIRWLIVDTLHHRTGLPPPSWDFSLLRQNPAAFAILVDAHYRYYQFNANMLVSLSAVYVARRLALGFAPGTFGLADLGFPLLACVFFLGSRDALRKYYQRAGELLRSERRADHRGLRKPHVVRASTLPE